MRALNFSSALFEKYKNSLKLLQIPVKLLKLNFFYSILARSKKYLVQLELTSKVQEFFRQSINKFVHLNGCASFRHNNQMKKNSPVEKSA